MNEPVWTPLLFVIAAPSGAGKTTLLERLQGEFPRLHRAITCTTRPPRPDETDGVSYFFLAEAEFERRARANAFLEHAAVHGYRYGSPRQPVADALQAGQDVMMNLDVQGAASVRECVRQAPANDPLRRGLVDIFIAPPSMAVLERRLRDRATDGEADISLRLRMAAGELERRAEFQYLIVNDRLDPAYDALRAIYLAEHHRQRA
jgi:guanylate kinase